MNTLLLLLLLQTACHLVRPYVVLARVLPSSPSPPPSLPPHIGSSSANSFELAARSVVVAVSVATEGLGLLASQLACYLFKRSPSLGSNTLFFHHF